MTATDKPSRRSRQPASKRHGAVAAVCGLLVLSMVGLAYAAVPLYRLFCQVTGYHGTPQKADEGLRPVLDRVVTVRFDANVAAGLPGRSSRCRPSLEVKVGENTLAFYRATNISDKPTDGHGDLQRHARQPSALLQQARVLLLHRAAAGAGQSSRCRFSFFVDPTIVTDKETQDLPELTLSYTFYPVAAPKKTEGQAAAASPGKGG